MAEQKLELIVDIDETGAIRGIKNVGDTVKKSNSENVVSVDKLKSAYAALGAAITGVVTNIAMKMAQTAAQFKEQSSVLSKTFGVDTSDMLTRLSKAVGGTVSQFDLLKAASKAMSLGVTTNVDDIAQLMEFAKIKSEEMGKDVTEVFDTLVEGIGKGSARVLTAVGIDKEAFDKHGISIDGITSKQKLLQLVLEKSGDYIKKNGDDFRSSADVIDSLSATFDNLKLKIGDNLLGALDKILPFVENLFNGLASIPGPVQAVTVGIAALTPVVYGLWSAAGPVGIALGVVATAIALITARAQAQKEEFQKLGDQYAKMAIDQWEFKKSTSDVEEETEKLTEAILKSGKSNKDISADVDLNIKKQSELRDKLKGVKERMDELVKVNAETGRLSKLQRAELDDLTNKYRIGSASIENYNVKINAGRDALGKRKQKAAELLAEEMRLEKEKNDLIDRLRKDELTKSTEQIDKVLKRVKKGSDEEKILIAEKNRIIEELNKKHADEDVKAVESEINRITGLKKRQSAEEIRINIEMLQALLKSKQGNAEAEMKINDAIISQQELLKKKFLEIFSAVADGSRQIIGAIMDLGEAMFATQIAMIDAVSEAQLEAFDKWAELEMDKLDQTNEASEELAEMEEEDKQRRLDTLAEERDAAIAAGDTELAAEKQREIDRIALKDKAEKRDKEIADAKAAKEKELSEARKKLEEDEANKKYKIELELFNFNKGLRIADSIIGTAAAVVSALFNPGGVAGAILAVANGITGAVQTGLIIAEQPPPPPKFAGGGTLGGAYSSGDVTPFMGNRGETIVNTAQGQNLFNNLERSGLLSNNGAGNVTNSNSTSNINNGRTMNFFGPVTMSGDGEFDSAVSSRLSSGGTFT